MREFIVVDFEATCWKGKEARIKRSKSEIIQIGAVKLNDQFEIIDRFGSMVRPVLEPELSDFCQELTGIFQEDVDPARSFDVVFKEFFDWSRKNDQSVPLYFFWAANDKILLNGEKDNKNILHEEIDYVTNRYLDLQRIYDTYFMYSKKQYPVSVACEMIKIHITGGAHDAVSDAENTARILKALRTKVDWEKEFRNLQVSV